MIKLNKGDTRPAFKELLDYRDGGTVEVQHFDGSGSETYTKSELIGMLSGFQEQKEFQADNYEPGEGIVVTIEVLIPNRLRDEWGQADGSTTDEPIPTMSEWDDEEIRNHIHMMFGVGAYVMYESAEDIHITHIDF